MTHTTTEEIQAFRQSAEHRQKLAALLDDPTLQLALSIIRKSAVPKPPTDTETNQLADICLARRYLLMSGVNQGLDKLNLLTHPVQANENLDLLMDNAYDHTLPAHLRTPAK